MRDFIQVHRSEEILGDLQLGFTIVDGFSSFIIAFSFFEHNTKNGVVGFVVLISRLSSLSFSKGLGRSGSLGMRQHDEMHLKVVILVVDSVLTRSMDMELVGLVMQGLVAAFRSLKFDITSGIKLKSTVNLSVSLLSLQQSADFLTRIVLSLEVESSVSVFATLSSDVSNKSLLIGEALDLECVSRVRFYVLSFFVKVNRTLMLSGSTLALPVFTEVIVTPITCCSSSGTSSKSSDSERFHRVDLNLV